jgi:hypothetical protein
VTCRHALARGAIILVGLSGLLSAPRAAPPARLLPHGVLAARDGAAGDHFGSAVAIQGDTAVVGAPDGAGAAYIFVRHGERWVEEAKLLPSGPTPGFGGAVAISGETVAVAAQAESVEVFVRRKSGWQRQAVLTAPDAPRPDEPHPNLGYTVALDGNVLVTSGLMGGAWWGSWVYVFERTGESWGPAVLLDVPGFDNVVAVSRGTVAVQDQLWGNELWVYTKGDGSWPRQATLLPEDSVSFLGRLAIQGDRVLTVGHAATPSDTTFETVAYAYQRQGADWRRTTLLRSTAALTDDSNNIGLWGAWFSGSLPVVGAWWGADGRATLATAERPGAPRFWHLTGFPARSVEAGDGIPAIALDAQTIAVGAPWSADQAGAAYVFQRPR